MAAAKRPPSSGAGSRKKPATVVTVARFEQAMLLLEQLVDENTDLFIGKMQSFRDKHRDGTDRPLTAEEAAQVAAALSAAIEEEDRDSVALAESVQKSELRAYDQPSSREVLLAAGVSTAPAFVNAALRMVALLELPETEFEAAYDAGTVEEAVDAKCVELRKLDLEEARTRASDALDLLAQKSGAGSGEGVRSLIAAVWRALNMAAEATTPSEGSGLSSLMGSLEPMGGADATSFTEPR
jgi:hypothetical protein